MQSNCALLMAVKNWTALFQNSCKATVCGQFWCNSLGLWASHSCRSLVVSFTRSGSGRYRRGSCEMIYLFCSDLSEGQRSRAITHTETLWKRHSESILSSEISFKSHIACMFWALAINGVWLRICAKVCESLIKEQILPSRKSNIRAWQTFRTSLSLQQEAMGT